MGAVAEDTDIDTIEASGLLDGLDGVARDERAQTDIWAEKAE